MTVQALDLAAFLALPWSDTYRLKLADHARRAEVQALVAWDNAGRLSCAAYTTDPGTYPAGTVAVWRRTQPLQTQDTVRSKTMQALDIIAREGMTPHAAAKAAGVHASAVYRALVRQQEKPLCPCCGQVVREGFEVDRSVLKDPAPGSAGA